MLFSFENLFSKMYHMEKKAISKERKYNFVGNSLMINFSRERESRENFIATTLPSPLPTPLLVLHSRASGLGKPRLLINIRGSICSFF